MNIAIYIASSQLCTHCCRCAQRIFETPHQDAKVPYLLQAETSARSDPKHPSAEIIASLHFVSHDWTETCTVPMQLQGLDGPILTRNDLSAQYVIVAISKEMFSNFTYIIENESLPQSAKIDGAQILMGQN